VIQPRVGGLPEIYVGQEQIRWWLNSLVAQHAAFGAPTATEVANGHARFTETFSADAFRQLGVGDVEVECDVEVNAEQRIRSMRWVLTPDSARRMQAAPLPAAAETIAHSG